MTRSWFVDEITTVGELLEFCSDNGCSLMDNVYSEEMRDDYMNESLIDRASDAADWHSFRDYLYDIPTGYDWYYLDDYGDWNVIDDYDFDNYKDDVLRWADDEEIFEEEDEEEEEDETPPATASPVTTYYGNILADDEDDKDEEDDGESEPNEEAVPFEELITTCNSLLARISEELAAAKSAEEAKTAEADSIRTVEDELCEAEEIRPILW